MDEELARESKNIDDNYYDWDDDWDIYDEGIVRNENEELLAHASTVNKPYELRTISNLYDFFEYCYNKPYNKNIRYVCYITNKQTVIGMGDDKYSEFTHEGIMKELLNKMFPERHYFENDLSHYEEAIGIYGYGYDTVIIDLPKKISIQQYESLVNLMNQVKQFEKNRGIIIRFEHIDISMKLAKNRIDDDVACEIDEVIIGTPHDDDIIIESIKRELNIENCKDAEGLIKIAFKIAKYYEDNYFKSIILKIIPNAEKIVEINSNLNLYIYYMKDLPLKFENLSYDNIQNYLQQLLSEAEMKRDTDWDDDDDWDNDVWDDDDWENDDEDFNEEYKAAQAEYDSVRRTNQLFDGIERQLDEPEIGEYDNSGRVR